jgi:hypothetical protein
MVISLKPFKFRMPSDLIVRGGADRSGKIFDDGS